MASKFIDILVSVIIMIAVLLASVILTGSVVISWAFFIITGYVEFRILPTLKKP